MRSTLVALCGVLLACDPPRTGSPSAPRRPDTAAEIQIAVRTPDAALAEELEREAPEANPTSELVTLRLSVIPAVEADVIWGGKRLGKVGAKPLEVQRPRNSGPLDVIVRAPGFMPFHTRLFTERDDKVTVRLSHL